METILPVLPGRVISMEESKPRLAASRDRDRATNAWTDPRFLLQIGVLVGGLLAIYFTDRSSDQAQLTSLNAAASNLSQGIAEMKGQVNSIQGSVNTLSGSVIALNAKVESLSKENARLDLQVQTALAYAASADKNIARLEARLGRNGG